MQCWIDNPATGGIDEKIKMASILLKTNIPTSIISLIHFRGKFGSFKKNLYILSRL